MPVAAVPNYIGQQFDEASPALRYNLLLPARRNSREGRGLWGKSSFKSAEAWKHLGSIPPVSHEFAKSLTLRQSAICAKMSEEDTLVVEAESMAPFVTGLGNEHPLENGFAFLNPQGIPYLPGSGVKGVLRRAARELVAGDWGDHRGWRDAERTREDPGSMIDALFGSALAQGESNHEKGALSFWDVIPQFEGKQLSVEIMTPHQGDYYQNDKSPYDSGSPNPILFLTVPPGSKFAFHVVCDRERLHTADLAENDRWKQLISVAFEHAFEWLGFGAKTSVGYGAMRRDHAAESKSAQRRAEAEEEQRRAQELAQLSPIQREMKEIIDSRPNKEEPESTTIYVEIKSGRWKGKDKVEAARWLKTELDKVRRSSLSSSAKRKHDQRMVDVEQWLAEPDA